MAKELRYLEEENYKIYSANEIVRLDYCDNLQQNSSQQGNQDEIRSLCMIDYVRQMIHNDLSPELIRNVNIYTLFSLFYRFHLY